ncbi:ASKHA domain-containing protein [Desulfovibrio inopinatus]|uniref:ASKHA domain-containing protein n=1 Tax=Desulfovibrio inopinatus TaxID=102109 RepID=UPI00040933AE|nr:ASKHA domain-containing protein [Desulfovibrio inopinatus]
MSFEIQVIDSRNESRSIIVEAGENLARALFRHGAFLGRPLCSGLGKCGQCRVRYRHNIPESTVEETTRLSFQAREDGYRFACLHTVRPGDCLIIESPWGGVLSDRLQKDMEPLTPPVRLAVDLGTTGIAWRFIDASGPGPMQTAPNPQLGAGADVMSRIAYALDSSGAKSLQNVLMEFFRDVIASAGQPVESMAIAGNTAMTSIFLGKRVDELARAPYRVAYHGGTWINAADGLPNMYVAPLLAPFIGGDLAAGLASLVLGDAPPAAPFLLADLGTNGEFVLVRENGNVIGTSVPMGPALEGIGLSQGSMALPGAVSVFHLGPKGLIPEYVDTSVRPRHGDEPKMTGAAYLSLVAILVRLGVLGHDGRFREADDSRVMLPLARALATHMTRDHGEPCFVWDAYRLMASDVEEILKVKAAFNLALCGLTQAAGMEPHMLSACCIAGAMGKHIRIDDLVTLGFLPQQLRDKTRAIGNASLDGTGLALMRESVREWLGNLHVDVVSLTDNPSFQNLFVESMVFDYVRATLSQVS